VGSPEDTLKLSAHFKRIADAPLTKQGTSDAWNERQNRLAASRDSAKLLIKGTIAKNQAKRAQEEVLPEDLAQALTAPQAWDRLMTLRHARTKEHRLHPSGSKR